MNDENELNELNPPVMDGYTKIPTFKLWVANRFPYMETDFDGITNYELMEALTNYLNNIIKNEENVESNVAKLNQAYLELFNYVKDYFDNLDVQEEINNKLDDLVADGTLTRLIGEYIQPLIDEQNEEISNFKTQVNNQIATQNAKIQAVESGSPLVASSVADMTDTTRVYVNTTDGNWYYYNGTNWISGGVYQSVRIASNSIDLNNFSNNLINFYRFKYDFVIGDVNGGNGKFNTTSTNRCRFIKKIWLEAGTLVRFNKGDTNYQYGYFMWDQLADTPIDSNLGWPTYEEKVLTESRYYCFRMRKSDNTDITQEELNDMTSRISFFRPISNRAGQLIDFYSTANPFIIQERYKPEGGINHNIKFTTNDVEYWLTFENLVQFHNHAWPVTNKRISTRLKYDIPSQYGTVDTTGANDMLDIVIPNNCSLVLNVVTGIISIKLTAEVEFNDATLIRCSQGRCITGAFREVYDYWRLRDIDTNVNDIDTQINLINSKIDNIFTEKKTNFYGVNKNNSNEVYDINQIVDINKYYNNGDIQSFVFDYKNQRIIQLYNGTTARLFSYNGDNLGTLTKPDTGHNNDACYVNGDVYIVGASYNNSKDVYKWNIESNTAIQLDMSAITDQENRNRNVIGGICETYPNSNKLYIVSANSNNTINHNVNDKINVYEYDINTQEIELKAEFNNDIIYVQGATCINGMLYIICNTLKENSTYHEGATIKVINTNTWQLVKEILVNVEDTEPEGATLVIENGICKLAFGIMGWSNTKASIYTMEIS